MDADDEHDEPGDDRRIPGWGFAPEPSPGRAPGSDGAPTPPPLVPDPAADDDGPAIPGWGPGVSTGPAPFDSPFPDAPPTEWPERIVSPQARRAAPSRARSPWPVLLGAGVVAVALLVGIVSVLRDDGGAEQSSAPPSTTTTTLPPAVPVPVAEVLDDVIGFVEQARGSTFLTRPQVTTATDAEYEEVLDGWLVRDRNGLDDREEMLRALGVLDDGPGYFAMAQAWRVDSSTAAYDPVSGVLMVRGDQVTPAGRVELARALASALDDEAYELGRTFDRSTDPEVGLAFQLATDRVAAVVAERYLASLGDEDRAAAERELAATRDAWVASVPPSVATLELASERAAPMVDPLFEDGPSAVDAMVVSPPTTVEQAFSAEAYAQGRLPFGVGVSAGPAAPESFARFTPLDLATMGIDPVPDELWAGGAYTRSTVDGRPCVQFRVLGVDDAATRALHVQVAVWADRTGAIIRRVFDQMAGREVVDGLRCD